MSWTWTIPLEVGPALVVRPPLMTPDHLRVVIPTFRDWDDARATVDSILACRPRPAEIVLVNDNTEPGAPVWVRRYPIHLVDYAGNRGPSRARNAGSVVALFRPIDWIYFTDTACERDPDFFGELIDASMSMPRATVAIAAPVVGVVVSPLATPINHYMTEEAILSPPRDSGGPQAIITANAAVSVAAFRALGGFSPSYPFAAAEDLDLGVRLRSFGPIGWAPRAIVRHRFKECSDDFGRRFVRYGAGNAHLEHTFGLPSMRVVRITARTPELQLFADTQVRSMQKGYDQHKLRLREDGERQHALFGTCGKGGLR